MEPRRPNLGTVTPWVLSQPGVGENGGDCLQEPLAVVLSPAQVLLVWHPSEFISSHQFIPQLFWIHVCICGSVLEPLITCHLKPKQGQQGQQGHSRCTLPLPHSHAQQDCRVLCYIRFSHWYGVDINHISHRYLLVSGRWPRQPQHRCQLGKLHPNLKALAVEILFMKIGKALPSQPLTSLIYCFSAENYPKMFFRHELVKADYWGWRRE